MKYLIKKRLFKRILNLLFKDFFLSFGKTASKQIQDTATHLKDVIEKNVNK